MLNKPKFMNPSINMYGNTVIDLNSDTLPFSCIVDGNEAITDFQIVVSKLSDNTVVFDTGMRTLQKPFFPINNRNQNVVFTTNLKDYFAKILEGDNKAFVNSADAYYWTISFKNSNSGTETYSSAEVFYANSEPRTTIYYSYNNNFLNKDGNIDTNLILSTDETNKSVLGKRKVFFKATYSQDEGVSVKRYGWRITDTSNNFVVIDTISNGQIYGIKDNISCECNGLLNNTDYSVELYIETQNGQSTIIKNNFKVEYDVKSIDAQFNILPLNNTSGIMLNWGDLKTTEGFVEGNDVSYTPNYPIRTGDNDRSGFKDGSRSINIPIGSKVIFANNKNGADLDVDEDSYVVLSFQIDKNMDVNLLEMSGVNDDFKPIKRNLFYEQATNQLIYTVQKGEHIVYNFAVLSSHSGETSWYVAVLSPMIISEFWGDVTYEAPLTVSENIAENALFPSNDIFPLDDRYPEIGAWVKQTQ